MDARIGKRSHNDKQGNTYKVCTVLYLEVAGSQAHLATVAHRHEWVEGNNPGRLRP